MLTYNLWINGNKIPAVIDTGCSVTLISKKLIGQAQMKYSNLTLQTMNGEFFQVEGKVDLNNVRTQCGYIIERFESYVVKDLPFNTDLVIGLDLMRMCGISICFSNDEYNIKFGQGTNCVYAEGRDKNSESCDLFKRANCKLESNRIEDNDFEADFSNGRWTISWKWSKEWNESMMKGCRVRKNLVDDNNISGFDTEIEQWISEGILIKHDVEEHGEIRNAIPMIAVRQVKGNIEKVRPVLDFRHLNKYIESHPGGAIPLCTDRLREWRQVGTECATLDLRKAYLQIHVHRALWVYQAVKWRGRMYLLTRLGFGLSSAPKIMTKIVESVINSNDRMKNSVSSYIDDLWINERKVPVDEVKRYFQSKGLQTKEPEKLREKQIRVLGLRVEKDLNWRRDKELPVINKNCFTRRQVHSVLGELLGHFPIANWLRVSCAYLQRLTAREGVDWDTKVGDKVVEKLNEIIHEINHHGDPARGYWPVREGAEITVWADASNVALGVVLEVDNKVVEDASWLRPESDSVHINRSELDAVVKGINMALRWKRSKIILKTDSATVFGWLKAVITKSHNIKTRALGEVLIRRRLDTIKEIIDNMNLDVRPQLIRSEENLADKLTRVPGKWLSPESPIAAVAVQRPPADYYQQLKDLHNKSHFGFDRTLELAREKFGGVVSRKIIKKIVSRCHRCQRIDPAVNIRWRKGSLKASNIWEIISMDLMHYMGISYLSSVDNGSGYIILKKLRNESSSEVCHHIQQILVEFGPPKSILTDNGSVFRSQKIKELLDHWNINSILSGAYRPQGNGIVERAHRTIKRAAKRSGNLEESVFWINCTKGKNHASPYEILFAARSRKPGITMKREIINRPEIVLEPNQIDDSYSDTDANPFLIGDKVYLKSPDGRCDQLWSGPHIVTELLSSVTVVINEDGISRHVSYLRKIPRKLDSNDGVQICSDSDNDQDVITEQTNVDSVTNDLGSTVVTESSHEIPVIRKSSRMRRLPTKYNDYVVY